MADETSKPPNPTPFDVRTVKALVALMTQHDLNEIDLRDGPQRLRLRRGANPQVFASMAPASIPLAVPAAASTNETPALPAKPARHLLEIKSETVGTFYAAPNPESPPFVTVGSRVSPTTVVCIIEAMKIHNNIEAGVAGAIAEILVRNQDPVEFGQVLFRVDPQG